MNWLSGPVVTFVPCCLLSAVCRVVRNVYVYTCICDVGALSQTELFLLVDESRAQSDYAVTNYKPWIS